jgi:hypothetical protein
MNWSHAFLDTPGISFGGMDMQFLEMEEKEMKVWYSGEPDINCALYLQEDEKTDTIKLRYTKSKDRERNPEFTRVNKVLAGPDASVEVSLKVPVTSFVIDSIFFLHDTLILPAEDVSLTSAFILQIDLPQRVYEKGGILILDNGALEEFRGARSDSVNIIVSPFDRESLGNIYLSVDTLNPDIQYIVDLRKKEGDWWHRELVSGKDIYRDSFFFLQPGVYEVEIIEDLDSNGRWSSGKYFEKVLPEKVFQADLEELKANWELEAKVEVNAVFKAN